MNTYTTGSGTQQIELMVDVSTLGLAASRAIILVTGSQDNGVSVAHSNDATGDIASTSIGSAKDIRNKRLAIFTKIDLVWNDIKERKAEYERIKAEYTLNGGDQGYVEYSDPVRRADKDFYTAFLIQIIDFI